MTDSFGALSARPMADALTALLADDYADNLAEGHRRHPTQYAAPFVTAHISISHPGTFRNSFRPYLETIFRYLLDPKVRRPLYPARQQDMDPSDVAARLASQFSFSNGRLENDLMLYELEDLRYDRIHGQPAVVWRLEVGREYLSFTIFARLCFESLPQSLAVHALPTVTGSQFRREIPHDADFAERVSLTLFRELERELEAHFIPLLDRIIVWATDFDAERELLQQQLDIELRQKFQWPAIFARFSGPVVPWTVYGPALRGVSVRKVEIWESWRGLAPASDAQIKHNTLANAEQRTEKCIDGRPFFPRFRERSIASATPDLNWALTCTNAFLGRIWRDLEASLLNGAKDDSVACYMQHGHALYISSLGGRASAQDNSASRYAIFYDDPEGASLAGPTAKSTDDPGSDCTRRISRLTGRMHELGVARLWALSGQASTKGFAQFLRSIELRLQELNSLGPNATANAKTLHQISTDFYDRLRKHGAPVLYSSTRTAHNLNVLDDLIEDLNVVQIPGRQPYDRFIRRRFRSGLIYLTGIGDRLQKVTAELDRRFRFEERDRRDRLADLQMDSTLLAAKSAQTIANLQEIADFFVRVLAFYYVPLTMKYAAEEASKVVVDIWRFPKEVWLDVSAIKLHSLIAWYDLAPSLAFLTAILVLYIKLPSGLIRDLVVFSRSKTRMSFVLLLAMIVFLPHWRKGRRDGLKKLDEVFAAEAERDAILRAARNRGAIS